MRDIGFESGQDTGEPFHLGSQGFFKGGIAEITGSRSSGKTGLVFSVLAQAAARLEFMALVDPTDSFDPSSAEEAGINLNRLLWVQCSGNLDAALKSTDYLLHAGGFGTIILDLADIRPELVSRIPLSYWFRFRLSVENKPTILLLISPISCAGSSCSLSLNYRQEKIVWTGSSDHLLLKKIRNKIAYRRKPAMLRAGTVRSYARIFAEKNKKNVSKQ